jgi:hypothetical protein
MRNLIRKPAPTFGAFLFFAALAAYLSTVAVTVTFWDSGELIAAASQLGISHQPGYPVFCLLGKLFSLVFPFGNIAYRVNLLSAVFSAAAAALVFAIIRLIAGGQGISKEALAASMACAYAFVRVVWSQAVVAEVYAQSSMALAALVVVHVLAAKGELSREKYFTLTGFIFGIGVVVHESFVLFLPGIAAGWFLVYGRPDRGLIKLSVISCFFIILGLSAWMYLPVRSSVGPSLDIGHPDNLTRLRHVLMVDEYLGALKGLPVTAEALAAKASFSDWRLWAGLFACGFAAFRLVRQDRRLFVPIILFALVYGLGIATQVLGGGKEEAFGLERKFFIPVFMLGFIMLGGLAKEALEADRRFEWAMVAVFAAAAVWLFSVNRFPDDYSKNFIAYDYAGNSLNSAGERGILFTWGDNGAFPLWYRQEVERYRDDVTAIHEPLMTYDWYLRRINDNLGVDMKFLNPYFLGENTFRIFRTMSPSRPVAYDYSTVNFMKLDEAKLKARGLVYFEGKVPPGDPWPMYNFRGVEDQSVFKGGMELNIIQIYEYQKKRTGTK